MIVRHGTGVELLELVAVVLEVRDESQELGENGEGRATSSSSHGRGRRSIDELYCRMGRQKEGGICGSFYKEEERFGSKYMPYCTRYMNIGWIR
jgi:hypothetical protein